jgi:hypothetical protein
MSIDPFHSLYLDPSSDDSHVSIVMILFVISIVKASLSPSCEHLISNYMRDFFILCLIECFMMRKAFSSFYISSHLSLTRKREREITISSLNPHFGCEMGKFRAPRFTQCYIIFDFLIMTL